MNKSNIHFETFDEVLTHLKLLNSISRINSTQIIKERIKGYTVICEYILCNKVEK